MGVSVSGRPVVITGGGNGIGEALARDAARRGASTVAILDIELESAQAVASSLEGSKGVAYQCDVTSDDSVQTVAESFSSEHGSPALVCANAGVGAGQAPALEASLRQAEWVMSVNFFGVLRTLQVFGRPMVESEDGGWLLVTGSEHSLGRPHLGASPYTASKHAVLGLCDVMRAELPDHVGVSLLCPGITTSTLWKSDARRPDEFGGAAEPHPMAAAVMSRGMGADVVARRALDGVEAGHFIIPTHYNIKDYADRRAQEVSGALERLAEVDTSTWHADDVIAAALAEHSGGPDNK